MAAASIRAVSFRKPVLAWSTAAGDEERFRRITRRVLAVVVLLAVTMPFVPRPDPETQRQALPPPLARLLLERQATPPAPPPPPQVAQADKPAADVTLPPKPEPPRKDERAPVPEARKPIPNKPPGEALANARRRASGVGFSIRKKYCLLRPVTKTRFIMKFYSE